MLNRVIRWSLLSLLMSFTANAQTTVVDSVFWGGSMHRYRVYVPAVTKCALVVHLHGYGSNGFLEQLYTNYMPIADTAGFVVLYPEGLVDQLGNQSWNVGWFGQTNNDDVGFISALIDTMLDRYSLDPSAVFASGISNGGFMCHRLACELNHKIAAIASVSGSMTSPLYSSCTTTNPISVLEIHGTNDTTIPYPGTTTPSTVHIDSVIKRCAELAGCNPVPDIDTLPHSVNTTNGTSVVHYTYDGGTNGASCELYKIINGAHVNWPGFDGSTTNDFNASKEIWRFFRNYRSCTMVGISEVEGESVNIYPNPSSDFINVNFTTNVFHRYELTDVIGKILIYGIIQDEQLIELDVSSYSSSLYFVRLYGENKQLVKKIMVK